MPTPAALIKDMDKEQLKKVSKKLAKELAAKIAFGVVVTVSVALISNAILSVALPKEDETPAE